MFYIAFTHIFVLPGCFPCEFGLKSIQTKVNTTDIGGEGGHQKT